MRIVGLFLAAFAAILIFTGCESTGGYRVTVESPPPPPRTVVVHEEEHHHHGPPPHAPAHGYRHKHEDRDLVFDRTSGCYTVVGYTDVYYNDGFYFRFGSDGWQISARIGDNVRWDRCEDDRVPGGLRTKYKDKGRGKEHKGGKGNHGQGRRDQQSMLYPPVQPIVEAARWGKY